MVSAKRGYQQEQVQPSRPKPRANRSIRFAWSWVLVLGLGCMRIGYDPSESTPPESGSLAGAGGAAATGAFGRSAGTSGRVQVGFGGQETTDPSGHGGSSDNGGSSSSGGASLVGGSSSSGGAPLHGGNSNDGGKSAASAGSSETQPSFDAGAPGSGGSQGGAVAVGGTTFANSGGGSNYGGDSSSSDATSAGQTSLGGTSQAGTGNTTFTPAATIVALTSSTSDGTYGIGASVDVTVSFSEAVTLLSGTLDIALDTGAVVHLSAFGPAISGSGTYWVGAGDVTADLDSTAVSLNGGELKTLSGATVDLSLPSATLRDRSNIAVDGSSPTISGFALTSLTPTGSHLVTFTLDGSDSGTGISGWLVDESAISPACNDPRWSSTQPSAFTLSRGYGTRTVYAWAKDGVCNVSAEAPNSIQTVELLYSGAQAWTVARNSAGDDMPKSAAVDYDDNLLVVGAKLNTTQDWQITKYAPDGSEVWNRTADWSGGSDSAQAIVVDGLANSYVAGWFSTGTDVQWGLKKYNANGEQIWTKEWNYSAGDDGAQALGIDSEGSLYLGGYVTSAAGDLDGWMKKYLADGSDESVHWNFGFDAAGGDDTVLSIVVDPSDNVYVVGHVTTSIGASDWLIRKYTKDAVLLWEKQYDRAGKNDVARSVTVDPVSGGIYVVGLTTANSNNIDWMIKKFDPEGNEDLTNWGKAIDYARDEEPWSIAADLRGVVYACGRMPNADDDWSVIKFGSNGQEIWRDIIVNPGIDWCRAVVVDSMNFAYGIGALVGTGFGTDWYIKKYVP